MRVPKSHAAFAFAVASVVAASGCQSTGVGGGGLGRIGNPLDWGAKSDEPRAGTPERVVATWIDAVRQTPGQPSERGFGGRIYFYDRAADPITVQGRLVVYAFDETGRGPTDNRPTRRYVFPPEQLAALMSVSEVGPSYSVWLPWGASADPPTDVSLSARFEPLEGGGLVASDLTRQRLPGQGVAPDPATNSPPVLVVAPSPGPVRQAGFDEAPSPARVADGERRHMSTTTIRLKR